MAQRSPVIEKHMEQLLFNIKRGFLLFTVLSLIHERPRYTYEIKHEVFRVTGGLFDIDRVNVYRKLTSLEREHLLTSFKSPSNLGADRKYYMLTPFGKKFYRDIYGIMAPVIDSFFERMRTL